MATWLWVLVIIAGIYLFLCLMVYLLQELFIFHPEKLPQDFKYRYEYPFEEVWLETEPGAKINGLHFKIPNSKGVVFYFKGNSRSVKGWGKFSKDFLAKGYDFFMIDYRGFGKSTGKRTEASIFHDCQMAYKHLQKQYEEEEIIIYGRSIGSGFAARIASWNNPKLMILDCPYYSFIDITKRYVPMLPLKKLLRYHIRTDQYIQQVDCAIYILHGARDKLIPYRASSRLAKLATNRTLVIPIKGAHHNNLPDFAAYHNHLYDILNNLVGETTLYDEIY